MTARWIAGMLFVSSLVMAGCGTKEGQRLVEFDRGGKSLQEKKASADGRYTLHAVGQSGVTFRVMKGERLGFRKTSDGSVEAFAGDNPAVELGRDAARDAYWEFEGADRR